MSEHEGLPVAGYKSQPDDAVTEVNRNKEIEERLLRRVEDLGNNRSLEVDGRWLAIAKTQFEQGFMAMNRAIFKPERVQLPEDADE